MTVTDKSTSTFEQYAFFGLVGCLGLVQLKLLAAYVPIALALVCWLVIVAREGRWPKAPAFFVPLLALAAWTLVSSAFSSHPGESFYRDRQLLYYLIVPLTVRVARGPRAMTAINVVIAVGAASALVGIVQYLFWGADENHRPHGILAHYMTYSGVLMLVFCAAIGRLVYRGAEWIWPAVAVPALIVALVVTESRNAWVGSLLAVMCLLSLRNWKLLVAVPAFLVVFVLFAPAPFRARAFSTFDSTNATNRDRVSMLKSGIAMIQDHPIVGVGPNMVPTAYVEHYRRPDALDPMDKPVGERERRSHLHNVPVQLAAERGLPALLAWLWFVAVAGRDLWRQARRSAPLSDGRMTQALGAIGLAVLVAAVAAGQFEHNFGDSEFLVLFLGLITLPFAAAEARSS
jgi:O-antigen ligase